MIPSQDMTNNAVTLIAAGTLFLAPVAQNNKLILFKNDINISPDTQLADIVEADFSAYAAILQSAQSPSTGLDPFTNEWIIGVPEPAGGWKWKVGNTGLNIPQTVYGYALVNNIGSEMIAGENFPVPIPVTAADQVIEIPNVTLRFPLVFMS